MIVLGIETSCDETSVAIVEKKKNEKFGRVHSEITLSQIEKHQAPYRKLKSTKQPTGE